MKYLIVVDMQNDFIDGALGSEKAVDIVPYVKELIAGFDGKVFFTRDTHFENYYDTQEGKKLPVLHCVKDTHGWQICNSLDKLRKTEPINKITFGSKDLIDVLSREEFIESITFVGLCTDICVISNVMLVKAFYPEIPIIVDAKGCAGVTPQSHKTALEAMKAVQVEIVNN